MAIGGTIAYLVSWRGVFATYAGLSIIATALLLSIAAASRGMAVSLAAFAFMGGGGIGTALGVRLINRGGFPLLYGAYALALAGLVILSFIVVRDVSVAHESAVSSRT